METTQSTPTLSSLPVARVVPLIAAMHNDARVYEQDAYGHPVTWIDFHARGGIVARVVIDSEGEPTAQTAEVYGFDERGCVSCSARFQWGFPITAIVSTVAGLIG